MNRSPLCAAALLACTLGSAHALDVPVNLNTWAPKGPARNGNWIVSSDGNSVLQTINGDPTFFVSPTSFINTALRGTIKVSTSGDDDYIGFVMGYNAPAASGNDMNYVLFDWKQADQGEAKEGFSLNRVNGTITNYDPGFWAHKDSAGFDNLASSYGTSLGWADNTEYTFEILYRSDRVTVNVKGGVYAAPTTVLDVAGSFPEGKFGFYNYSQAQVAYAGITQESLPPVNAVPEPETYALMGLGLVGVAWVARRRSSRHEASAA